MTGCETDLLIDLKRKINSTVSERTVINDAAKSIASQTGLAIDFVEDRLSTLLQENTQSNKTAPLKNIKEFFRVGKVNNIEAYTKVKREVRRRVISEILNGNNSLVRTNKDVNNVLFALQRRATRGINLNGSLVSPLAYYINMTQNDDVWLHTLNNTSIISQYLLSAYLPTVIESWISDLVKYDINTQKYSLVVDSHIRQDWGDNPENEEAQLNSLLETMCKATVLYKFNTLGEVEKSYDNTYLTKNSFFAAMNYEIKNMSHDVYVKYIEDPYTLIDYLINKYKDIGAHSILEENITHSIVYTWLHNDFGDTNFYKNAVAELSETSGYNLLDIIVKNSNKFTINSYIEYNLSEAESILTLSMDENSKEYSRLTDNITLSANDLDVSVLNSIILKDSKSKYYLNNNYKLSDLEKACKYFFGPNIVVDESNSTLFQLALMQIIDYRNSNSENDFMSFLKSDSDRAKAILSIMNNINAYNPYSITGTVNNKLNIGLPTIGLASVASTIEENIYRNRSRNKRLKEEYEYAKSLNQNIIIPTAPYEHTILYNHKKNGFNNIFLGTVYRTTMSKEINKEIIIKDTNDLSISEAFYLTIYQDFLNKWESSGDEVVRIEAITPSDKPKIPLFEFSTRVLKSIYGVDNKTIENTTINQLKAIYGQYLLNSLNDFIQVLEIPNISLISNINDIYVEDLISHVENINNWLKANNITKDIIYTNTFNFNNKYRVNKNIAENHDFVIINGDIQISSYLVETVKLLNSENPFDQIYLNFLQNLPENNEALKLYNYKGLTDEAKNSNLYTYFLLKNILSDNILVNTVGLPLSHKAKGDDFYSKDSSAQITMVKRMVALTATTHACLPTALSGLSSKINMMTVSNDVAEMFAYSGNATSGNGFKSKLEISDGAMFSLRFVDNLLKQSITDTKPKGIDLKLLLHSLDPEKASAYLSKLASFGIDNAMLRTFGDYNLQKVGGINARTFMELSTKLATFRTNSFNSDGLLIDYNGNELEFDIFVNIDGDIYEITDIRFSNNKFFATKIAPTGTKTDIGPVDNNLYDFWRFILGGEFSSDASGIYGEQSQDQLSEILNKVGNKINDNVMSQKNVDQYLKKQVTHYFCTESAQKSTKAPVVNLLNALEDPNKAWTIKLDIDNFGIQLDADHDAADASIREITQLISFITENGYVPNTVKSIYRNLARLIHILGEKTFIDIENISNPIIRKEAAAKLDSVFAKRIERVLTNPNENVMGLVNEIMAELQNLGSNYKDGIKPPYSDHQMLGKLHTTVGSYLNKFISRNWTGRGDVLVPSHNMFMLYEDDDNIKFMFNDFKYNDDGSKTKAPEYLHNKVWNIDLNGNESLKPEYIATHTVSPYEVMPVDVYYRINPNTNIPSVVIINTWFDLNNVTDEILSGITYVKAIDLPRNLRSKRAFIDLIIDNKVVRVGLYHLKTFQEIAKVGNALDSDLLYKDNVWSKDKLISHKKQLQLHWENVVLKAIDERNINVISDELPNNITNSVPTNVSYVVFNEERATTNYYSNKFGIKDMNFSEIQQRKANYFKENLLVKFDDIGVNYDYLLYASSGDPTLIYENSNTDFNGYINSTAIVDEDGYRIDNNGDQMYKWPNNARLLVYKYGNRSADVIVTKDIETIIDDDFFILYRSKKNINRKNFYNLNNGNQDIIFNALAQAQYESWEKTNTAIMARIPSQSLAFAMNIDTIAYLPYYNNISFVPNQQVFLQGSDYDIDKAYCIMSALGYNGIYKYFNSGSLSVEEDLKVEDLTDTELELNEDIAKLVFDNLESDLSVDTLQLATSINNIIGNSTIRVNKDFIINTLSTNIVQSRNDDARFLGIARKNKIQVEEKLNKIINNIKLELFALHGLRNSKKDQQDSVQNYILESIKDVYNSPKTLSASTNPTTMEPINSAVKDLNLEGVLRNHWDPSTDIYINQSTSVGKVDIGISAVAQKAFYAITYYNELKYENNQSLLNIININLPKDWVYDRKSIFSLGFAGSKVNEATLKALNDWIVTQKVVFSYGKLSVYTSNNVYFIIEEDELKNKFIYYGQSITDNYSNIIETKGYPALKSYLKWVKVGDNLCDFIATTINASFISSATDNAKEMKLDLLNASPEILPIYEYFLSIGIPPTTAAKILTDPIIPKLVSLSKGNLFKNAISSGGVSSILNTSLSSLATKLFENGGTQAEINKIIDKLKIYRKLFKGARELTSIGTTLGINGGIDVVLGAPLLYQLNVEYNIKKLSGVPKNFSAEIFFNNLAYAESWIQILERNKTNYNLLDIIYSVPHYKAMFEVPFQFKNIMQVLSKDIDNTYTSIYNSLKYKYKIDEDVVRQVLRVFNDRKIFEYFRDSPFTYVSNIALQQKVNNGYKMLTKFEEIMYNDPIMLSTDSVEGLVTLKKHIENVIIPALKRDFSNNEFVKNLIFNSQFNTLFAERVGAYGSRINLSDNQYEDVTAMIKYEFYKIQYETIAGHSIFDWMFIYDLLNYKHTINRNSFSILFDGNIDFNNPNNLVTKWIKFVNQYDSLDINYPTLLELSSIPTLVPLKTDENPEDDMNMDIQYMNNNSQRPRWAIDPKYMPLFVKVNAFNNQTLMNRNILSRAFSKGLITVTLC